MTPKLLIVDDNPENRYVINQILEDFPIDIHEAADGEKAIEKVGQNSYFAILMDISMPDMDGFECVENIRSQQGHRHIPIIFITAMGFKEKYLGIGYKLGAVDYMVKPVDDTMLRSKVRVFLDLEQRTEDAKTALADLREQKRNQELMLNYIADGIVGVDKDYKITYANAAACMLLTSTPEEIVGSEIKDFVNPMADMDSWMGSDFIATYKEGQCNHCDDTYFWRQKRYQFPVQYTQSSIFCENDVVGGMLVFQDITERKDMENQLVKLAKYDQLTGLANRSLYWEFLEKSIEVAKRSNTDVYLLFIDLDRFKEINDSLGHDAGDLLLIHTAERLRGILRSADLVSRLGGDEFSVIIQQAEREEDVARLCEKIIAAISKKYSIYGQDTYIGCSIGIARFPTDGETSGALTKSADTAMYSAKSAGRNTFSFFQHEMHERVESQLRVANELRTALDLNQIVSYFQPKVDIKSGRYIGAEALARWVKPDHNIVSPALFIPVAEDTGLIENLGQEILNQAGKVASQSCQDMELGNFRISVNVSTKQLRAPNFAKRILKQFERDGIDPLHMDFEITESSLMLNSSKVYKELSMLRDSGMHISIDDFGTGYSSLAYIKNLPIDTLKIDRSFVRDIGHDSSDEKIVKAIIQLAHSLELKVIAEGVETQEQLAFLKALDCDYAQGFLFSRPKPSKEFLFLLQENMDLE